MSHWLVCWFVPHILTAEYTVTFVKLFAPANGYGKHVVLPIDKTAYDFGGGLSLPNPVTVEWVMGD